MNTKKTILYQDYIAKINKVLDYIDKNLEKNPSLNELAQLAAFSQYHFHRIFRSIVGEPVNKYIKRRRLEAAANLLLINNDFNITDVAENCGFTTSAELARQFKHYFRMSATEWRKGGFKDYIKIAESIYFRKYTAYPAEIKIDYYELERYSRSQIWKGTLNNKTAKVAVKDESGKKLAYVRIYGDAFDDNNRIFEGFNKLISWGKSERIQNIDSIEKITIMHDNPHITETEKLKMDVCIPVPDNVKANNEIGKLNLAGGLYGIGSFNITTYEIHSAFDFMSYWLFNKSAYKMDNARKCYMAVLPSTEKKTSDNISVRIYIPIKYN